MKIVSVAGSQPSTPSIRDPEMSQQVIQFDTNRQSGARPEK